MKEADVNQNQRDQFIFHHGAIALYIIKIQLDNEIMTAFILTIFLFHTGGAMRCQQEHSVLTVRTKISRIIHKYY